MASRGEPVDLLKWRRALRHPSGPRSPIVRHVLLTLATWGDSQGGSMFPGTETLAVATGLARNTVAKALKSAIADGWVDRSERNRRGPYGKPRFCYEATVPAGWSYENDVDHPWETDPTWTSERRNRGRLGFMSRLDVPHQVGDSKPVTPPVTEPVVPHLARACPPSGEGMSPISGTVVPHLTTSCPPPGEHDLLMTSSVTSSVTSSEEGALARTARVSGERKSRRKPTDENPETKPEPSLARANTSDSNALAPEGSARLRKNGHTLAQGLKFIALRLKDPDCVGLSHALAEAQSLGYPVTEAQAHEHVATPTRESISA